MTELQEILDIIALCEGFDMSLRNLEILIMCIEYRHGIVIENDTYYAISYDNELLATITKLGDVKYRINRS